MCRSGITHEEMVQESKRHWQRLEQNAQKHQKVSKDEQIARPSAWCLLVCLFDNVVHLAYCAHDLQPAAVFTVSKVSNAKLCLLFTNSE